MRRPENHTGWGFCSHTRTVVAARFLWRSQVAPRRSRKWRVTYRIGFVPYFGAMWTPIRPVTEVNKWERGLEPTETEVKNIQELGIEFSTPNSFRQPRRHDVRRVWTTCVVLGRCHSLRSRRYCVGARLKFWRQSRDPKKGVGTRRYTASYVGYRCCSYHIYRIAFRVIT